MATINKKTAANEYERIADTQGLLIPQAGKSVYFQFDEVADKATPFRLTCRNINDSGIGLKPDGSFPAKQGDVFAVFLGTLNVNQALQQQYVFVNVRYTAGSSTYITQFYPLFNYYPLGNSYLQFNGGVFKALRDGDICFQIYCEVNLTLTDIQRSFIAKLEQQVPDLVANRGALISSPETGKVSFGDDGIMKVNADYPQPGVEQDTGQKWYDGRTVYRKIFTGLSIHTSGWATVETGWTGRTLVDVRVFGLNTATGSGTNQAFRGPGLFVEIISGNLQCGTGDNILTVTMLIIDYLKP
jgi:hypothetical protein